MPQSKSVLRSTTDKLKEIMAARPHRFEVDNKECRWERQVLTIGDAMTSAAGKEPSRIACRSYGTDGKIVVAVESYCHQVTKRNSEELGGKSWEEQMDILHKEHERDIEESPSLLSAWLYEFHDVIDQKLVDCQDIDEGIQQLCNGMPSLLTSYWGDPESSLPQSDLLISFYQNAFDLERSMAPSARMCSQTAQLTRDTVSLFEDAGMAPLLPGFHNVYEIDRDLETLL
jgi:hypothetical protein